MRVDGRKADELRKIKITRNYIKSAEGSVMIRMHAEVDAFLRALADATAGTRKPRRQSRTRRAAPALEPSTYLLAIASDGDRLQFELRNPLADGTSRSLWVGSTTWLGFETLRRHVISTFEPASTLREWSRRIERAGAALSRFVPTGLRAALAR